MGKCDGQNQYSLKKLGEGLKQMTVTGPGRSKLEKVKKFLACLAIFRPTPGFKRRTSG